MINNYRDLPLEKYLLIQAVAKDEGLDEIEKQVHIISHLSGISPDDLMKMPLPQYRELAAQTAFLQSGVSVDAPEKLADKYVAGDYTLVPVRDFDKLTTAQFIDFQAFAKDLNKYFAEMLSVALIPEGKKYADGYDCKDVQKAIREHMNTEDALVVAAHFFVLSGRSAVNFLDSCAEDVKTWTDRGQREKAQMMIRQALSALSGVGLRQ